MKHFPVHGRTLALLVVLVPLLTLFVYVAVRSGPLAPVKVTVTEVEHRSISPGLFGIGTVEARSTYRIGPTFAGRLQRLDVDVGNRVQAGDILGEMDPVDLDDRLRAQQAALLRAEAQLAEAGARRDHARVQERRYEELWQARSASEETHATKRQELQIAEAGLKAATQELARIRAELEALTAQRENLRLIAPADGLITAREVEPGTTVVAGQTVVELIDPTSVWINVRFDQIQAGRLAADLPALIVLRSRGSAPLTGSVLRVEPLADAVTEETLAKVVFDRLPDPLPPIGELAEVTVALPALPAGPVITNAAIHRIDGRLGVWLVTDGEPRFTPVDPVTSDLAGQVVIRAGLEPGDRVVAYSEKALHSRSRIHVVGQLTEAQP
jgi:HlyD family secretion protein